VYGPVDAADVRIAFSSDKFEFHVIIYVIRFSITENGILQQSKLRNEKEFS